MGIAMLSGCGFAPAYGVNGGAEKLRGTIHLTEPKNRNAYLVTQRFEERMGYPGPSAPWYLQFEITTRTESAGNTKDGKITRYQLIGNLNYTLSSTNSKVAALTGKIENFAGYSATGSTVATLAAQRDAQERLMTILADALIDDLLLSASSLP